MNEAIESDRFAVAVAELLSTALQGGGDLAEIFAEATLRETLVLSRRGRRTSEQQTVHEISGTGVRILSGLTERFNAIESLEPEDIRASLQWLQSTLAYPYSAIHSSPSTTVSPPVHSAFAAAPSEKRAVLEQALDAALSLEPDLVYVEARLQCGMQQVMIASTEGQECSDTSSHARLRLEAELVVGGRRLVSHAVGGGASFNTLFEHSPEAIAAECIERLRRLREASPALAVVGELPVVIAAGWGGVWLHEAIGHLLEADIAEGGPYAPSKLGHRVAAPGVTLIDDPTDPRGRIARRVDDEGLTSHATLLIEDGILRGLMTDRLRARALGLPRTANARRQDFRHPPLPRMTNFIMEKGDVPPDQLIGSTRSGIYVTMVGNGRVEPEQDRFSFDVLEGYLIESGRLGAPVTSLRIEGRPSEVLQRVEGIADDVQFDSARGVCVKGGQRVDVALGAPTVLINRLSVAPIAP